MKHFNVYETCAIIQMTWNNVCDYNNNNNNMKAL